MLQELRIKNFAIIDELTLPLSSGFLVITGETGAGKSIIVDAVNLLLGERADTSFIRGGTDRAVVEGIFTVPNNLRARAQEYLQSEGLEGESPDEVILSREIRANGRSQSRVNGVSCSLTVYRELGGMLVDIHGQGEHLSLLRPSQHLYLLDRYGNLDDKRGKVRELVREADSVRHEINSLLTDEAALARRIDMLQYQIQEIETANLRPEEEEELKIERNRQMNSEKIAELATEAQYALAAEEASAVDLLSQVSIILSKLAKLDPTLEERASIAENLSIQAEELAHSIRQYHDSLEFDRQRLNDIEERLEVLTRLKRKYGGTIEAVLAYAEKAQTELNNINNSEERLIELREEEEKLLRQIGELAGQLSDERKEAAGRLTGEIEKELGDLKMQNARFEVHIDHRETPDGCYIGQSRRTDSSAGESRLRW
jgi:DNA repair protein RecN (Recombination protein N)